MTVFVVKDGPGLPVLGACRAADGMPVTYDPDNVCVYIDAEAAHQRGWPKNPGDLTFKWVVDLWLAASGSFPVDVLVAGRPMTKPDPAPVPLVEKPKGKKAKPDTPSLFD